MSVIVNDDIPIELALVMFWREASRENLPDVTEKNRYRVKPASERHEQRKIFAKTKRRRKAEKRKLRRKGIGI